MTPSEVAERLHDLADGSSAYWDEFYTQAAAKIRTQAEALEIATEALEEIAELEGNDRAELAMLKIEGFGWPKHDKALARINEVTE